MQRVIVTGGTGFLGSWLVQELLQNDMYVTVVVRDSSKLLPTIKNSKRCSIIQKSIEDLTGDEFDKSDLYDVFFHLGWSGVAPEQKNDIELQLGNIEMSLKALEICSKLQCKKFIAAGTVAEYVFCDDVMDFSKRESPNDMYGAAKVSTYHFLNVRARCLQQPFIWMVLPSVFGERRGGNNIISYTIRSLLNNEVPNYGNLQQMWDFLYVSDVVRAIRLIGEKGFADKVYGIGSGQYRPMYEYIQEIRDIVAPQMELGIGVLPAMSNQTKSSCVSIYDLVKDTGFSPKVSFKDGIMNMVSWMRNEGEIV